VVDASRADRVEIDAKQHRIRSGRSWRWICCVVATMAVGAPCRRRPPRPPGDRTVAWTGPGAGTTAGAELLRHHSFRTVAASHASRRGRPGLRGGWGRGS